MLSLDITTDHGNSYDDSKFIVLSDLNKMSLTIKMQSINVIKKCIRITWSVMRIYWLSNYSQKKLANANNFFINPLWRKLLELVNLELKGKNLRNRRLYGLPGEARHVYLLTSTSASRLFFWMSHFFTTGAIKTIDCFFIKQNKKKTLLEKKLLSIYIFDRRLPFMIF